MKNYLIIIVGIFIVAWGVYFLLDFDIGGDVVREKNGELADILKKAEEIDSLKYDVTVDSPGENVTGTFWQKGEKLKLEGKVGEREIVVIIDKEIRTAYTYIPEEGVATQVSMDSVREVKDGSIKKQAGDVLRHEPVILKEETLSGKECVVIEYTTPNIEGKMWVWKEHGLPLRVEVEEERGVTVMEAENIDLTELSEDVFDLPPGVEVMEVPVF